MISMLKSRAFGTGDRWRNEAVFCLEAATGARISEILSLTRSDVIGSDGRLREKITLTETKTGKRREVVIVNSMVAPSLIRWINRMELAGWQRGDDPLFPSPRKGGRAITRQQIYNVYRKAIAELGLAGKYGTHSCRKTWAKATYLYWSEKAKTDSRINPVMKVKEAGGWAKVDSTVKYLDFLLTDAHDAQAHLYPGLRGFISGESFEAKDDLTI